MKHSTLYKILAMLVYATGIYASHPELSSPVYTYVVKADYDHDDPIDIKCSYKGCAMNINSEGIAFLPEKALTKHFSIIITPEPPKLSRGTVPHLERIPDVDCLWYDISWEKDGLKTVWTIDQRSSDMLPSRIPHNAIIICYPVEFVEKLEYKTPDQTSGLVIHLPSIILKKGLSEEEREKRDNGLTRSILAHLDFNTCVTPAAHNTKKA